MAIDIGVKVRNVGNSSLVRYYPVKYIGTNSNTREVKRFNECTVYSYIILVALVDEGFYKLNSIYSNI